MKSSGQKLFLSISFIINENRLVDSDFLGYKDIICKNILEVLQKKEFDDEKIFNIFLVKIMINLKKFCIFLI